MRPIFYQRMSIAQCSDMTNRYLTDVSGIRPKPSHKRRSRTRSLSAELTVNFSYNDRNKHRRTTTTRNVITRPQGLKTKCSLGLKQLGLDTELQCIWYCLWHVTSHLLLASDVNKTFFKTKTKTKTFFSRSGLHAASSVLDVLMPLTD